MLCFVVLNHLGWHSVDKGDHRLSKHIHSVLDWSNLSNVINLFVTGLWDPDSNRREKSKPFLTDTNLTTVWFTWHASGVLFRVECLSRLRKVSWECHCPKLDRQVETETTEGTETQWVTWSRMSKSTHARARWTCTHSHVAHTIRKWQHSSRWVRCCLCPHIHILWSGTSELDAELS